MRITEKYIKTSGIQHDELSQYAWFPVTGNSMTNENNPYSIPDGSKVLAREIEIKKIFDYPLRRPVIITGFYNNEMFVLVKTISFVDGVANKIRCKSFNPEFQDFYIPEWCIEKILVVEQILRPRKRKSIKVNC